MELRAKCLKNLFPVLMGCETAARRKSNHMTRVELTKVISMSFITSVRIGTYTSSGAKAWQPGDSVIRML
jgi:hypothetical protein